MKFSDTDINILLLALETFDHPIYDKNVTRDRLYEYANENRLVITKDTLNSIRKNKPV